MDTEKRTMPVDRAKTKTPGLDSNVDLDLSKLAPRSNYWSISSSKLVGNDQPTEIYTAVGKAISHWEAVELSMVMFLGVFIESESLAAFRVYGGITSATSRKEALQNAGDVFFSRYSGRDSYKNHFRLVLNNYIKGAALRNNLAHGTVIDTKGKAPGLQGSFLISPLYNSRKVNIDFIAAIASYSGGASVDSLQYSALIGECIRSSNYRYTEVEITQISEKFSAFAQTVIIFVMLLTREFKVELLRRTKKSD